MEATATRTSTSGQPGGAVPQLGLREQGKQRRVGRILDAGLELLREDPAETLTVDRIAVRAEVSPMTVFNLVGSRDRVWSAMADRALRGLDIASIEGENPQERARQIMDAAVGLLCQDSVVFRTLLLECVWSFGGLENDPTSAFIECFEAAAERGEVRPDMDPRVHGEVIAAGLIGIIHQWLSGLLDERGFRNRGKALVDIVFAGAR